MSDLLKLLDGSIDDVKNGLAGKSRDDLIALRTAEQGGKTRKGVLDALTAAIGGEGGDNGVAPATEIDTAGAPQQIVPDVDMSHPAVDNDPRANTTADQNRIDFNDPTESGQETVERQLAGN